MTARHHRPNSLMRALVGLLVLLTALHLPTGASAAQLGGITAQNIGAAQVQTRHLPAIDATWTPRWYDGDWQLERLTVAAPTGSLAGARVHLTVDDGNQTCATTSDSDGPALTLSADQLTAGCPVPAPRLTDATRLAVVITDSDAATQHDRLGEVRGALSAFAAQVVHPEHTIQPSTESDDGHRVARIALTVPGATVADLTGANVAVVTTAGHQVSGTAAAVAAAPMRAATHPDGAQVIVAFADGWALPDNTTLHAAIATSQELTATGASGGIATTSWQEAASGEPGDPGDPDDPEEPEDPEDPGEPDDPEEPDDPGQTDPPPATGVDNALDPVGRSPGLQYDYQWNGGRTNGLNFCHNFTITNTTAEPIRDWMLQFDTSLPPLWGADPTVPGTVNLGQLQTRDYDAGSGLWTVGGAGNRVRDLAPGQKHHLQYCTNRVPTPEPDPALFDVEVSVDGNANHAAFSITLTSDSSFYVPWAVEIDLADLVCPASLEGKIVNFSRVVATPVPGSTTRYLIQGTPGDTQLVGAHHPRQFEFAYYTPGLDWQHPCTEPQG